MPQVVDLDDSDAVRVAGALERHGLHTLELADGLPGEELLFEEALHPSCRQPGERDLPQRGLKVQPGGGLIQHVGG